MKIYLSPSNQPHNKYAYGGTNEKVQMESVAKSLKQQLEVYDVEVILATLNLNIAQRDDEAKNHHADLYLAIHSNSTGTSYKGATGTVAFYHPDAPITRTLANNLVDELGSVIPYKENRYAQVINGMLAFNRVGYHEIREPMKHGVPSCLVEVDFHDNPKVAEWIVNNTHEVAKGIKQALVNTYGLKPRVVVKPIEKGNTMYKVQIGAFNVKANAQKRLQEAVNKGFKDAYIVEVGVQDPTPAPAPKPRVIEVGSTVQVKQGSKSYEGKSVATFVYGKKLRVDELKGDRAVLDKQGIHTAFNIKDLILLI